MQKKKNSGNIKKRKYTKVQYIFSAKTMIQVNTFSYPGTTTTADGKFTGEIQSRQNYKEKKNAVTISWTCHEKAELKGI